MASSATTMHKEIKDAVEFLCSHLYGKVPRRKVVLFGQVLANYLVEKFNRNPNGWDPANPSNDAANRLIKVNMSGQSDALVALSATDVGLEAAEVVGLLPASLSLSVNPGAVTYSVGMGRRLLVPSAADPAGRDLAALFGNVKLNDNTPRLMFVNPSSAAAKAPLARAPDAPAATAPVFEGGATNDVKFTVAAFATTRFGTSKQKTNLTQIRNIQSKVAKVSKEPEGPPAPLGVGGLDQQLGHAPPAQVDYGAAIWATGAGHPQLQHSLGHLSHYGGHFQ